MKMNKKALVFEPLLVLFAIVILSASFYNYLTSKGVEAQLGNTASDLIELDKESKLKLDLVEHASYYHIFNSIAELGKNSGYSSDQLKKCESWSNMPECSITKEILLKNLKKYLELSFNSFAKAQNLDNYKIDVSYENEKIIATFESENLKFAKGNIEITRKHKFSKEVKYDLNKFIALFSKFSKEEGRLEKCPVKNEKSISLDSELLEPGLACLGNENSKGGRFLNFEYRKEAFFIGNNPGSFLYPQELQPVIKFRILKLVNV